MFAYDFIRRAFMVGCLLAVKLPMIGLPIILKRQSMLGDTLAHSSLAGVAAGLAFGFNPLLGSVVACVLAAFMTTTISSKLTDYKEIASVIVLGASIGLAGVFTSICDSSSTINSYLFGSIVTISNTELYLVLSIALVVLVAIKYLYVRLYLAVFDESSAGFLGIDTKALGFIFSILVAISISIAAKTIGSLIVSSLLVLPVILAMQFSKTYKQTIVLASIFSCLFVWTGLFISYFYDLKPGSVIVLIATFVLLITLFVSEKVRR